MALSENTAKFIAPQVETLGDIAVLFRALKEQGITKGSVEFVTMQVWWE